MASTPQTIPFDAEKHEDISAGFEPHIGSDPYLFVSYSHRDKAEVYPILKSLHDRKFRIWYDEACETGNDFRDELRDRIMGSEAILLFVSKSSMTSKYCGMEIIVAYQNNKRIFPIFVEQETDELVPPAFKLVLDNLHHLNISDRKKLVDNLARDLPPVTMNRLSTADGRLESCEDNGESIEVDDDVVTIGKGAFQNKRVLRYIQLPESLKTIEPESFRGCSSLERMVIPIGATQIGESAFRDCINLQSLTVHNPKIKIGERAFENCVKLSSITLPDGLTEIYGGVFNSCKALISIKLPSELTILGESAFSDCIGLKSIDVPETVTKIDDLVFNGCTALKKVTLHEGLKKIGKAAFKNCKALTSITLPSSVSSLNDAPFRGCAALRSIRVEPKNKYFKSEPNRRDGLDHVLFNKNKSILIAYPANSSEVYYDVPDSVVVISDWAFNESRELSRITIPDSVQEIGEGAFSNCIHLNNVSIPDSVVKIDDCAFRGCTSLRSITIPSSVKEFGWGVFDGCEETITVYCDEGSAVEEYCIRKQIAHAPISEKEAD